MTRTASNNVSGRQPGEVTQSEFAVLIGVSQPRVARYIGDGKLDGAVRRDGRRTWINRSRALELLQDNLDPINPVAARIDEPQRRSKKPAPKSKPAAKLKAPSKKRGRNRTAKTPKIDADDVGNYTASRQVEQHYKALLKKSDYEERQKELMSTSQVMRTNFAAARACRDAILAVPVRVAPIFAAETEAANIANLLTVELKGAIAEFIKTMQQDLELETDQ